MTCRYLWLIRNPSYGYQPRFHHRNIISQWSSTLAPDTSLGDAFCELLLRHKVQDQIGITVITDAAICKFKSPGVSAVTKLESPTAIGRQSSLIVTSSGHIKAFQEPMNPSVTMVMIGALDSGKTTLRKNLKWPAPSIRAASHRSFGI